MKASPSRLTTKRLTALGASLALTACGAVTATQYLWRSHINLDEMEPYESISETHIATTDPAGNTYALFSYDIYKDGEISGKNLRKISPAGAEVWRVDLTLEPDDVRCITANDDALFAVGLEKAVKVDGNGSVQAFDLGLSDWAAYKHCKISDSGKIYVSYEISDKGEEILYTAKTTLLDADGNPLWSYAEPNARTGSRDNSFAPAVELSNGNTLLIAQIGSSSGDDSSLRSILIDPYGDPISKQTIAPHISSYNSWQTFAAGDDVLLLYKNTDVIAASQLVSLHPDGTIKWQKELPGQLRRDLKACSQPAEGKIVCATTVDGISKEKLHWIDLADGQTLFTSDIELGAALDMDDPIYPIIYAGAGRWLAMELHIPPYATSILDNIFPTQLYSRLHLLGDDGRELKTITLQPGKVLMGDGPCDFCVAPKGVSPGDYPQQVMTADNQVIVLGVTRLYFSGDVDSRDRVWISAYAME